MPNLNGAVITSMHVDAGGRAYYAVMQQGDGANRVVAGGDPSQPTNLGPFILLAIAYSTGRKIGIDYNMPADTTNHSVPGAITLQ